MEARDLDIKLFERITEELLPQGGVIHFLRKHDFGIGVYQKMYDDYIIPLHDIVIKESKRSDFEFINPELELIKNKLVQSIADFTGLISTHAFPARNGRLDWFPIEEDLKYSSDAIKREKRKKIIDNINNTTTEIHDTYDELVRKGRAILTNKSNYEQKEKKVATKKRRKALSDVMKKKLQVEINNKCPFCSEIAIEIFVFHHIDEDSSNTVTDNLIMICPSCHAKIHKSIISKEEVLKVKNTLKS